MKRRDFLHSLSATGAALLSGTVAFAKPANSKTIDAKAFHASRRFADLPVSRVAYVERGHGLAALFIHGYPLNGFQWRGALERLHAYRRCIAPDVMGMGYTQTPKGQKISPETQATMLAMLLDSLHIDAVDQVANDSGGLVAQLFLAKYPRRLRTLLLTNCDVDENSPPPQFLPFIEQAKKGTFVDKFIVPQLRQATRPLAPRNGRSCFHKSRKACGRNHRDLFPPARRDATQEIPGKRIRRFHGNKLARRNTREPGSMERASPHGVGTERRALQCEVGRVGRPYSPRLARHKKSESANLFFPEEMPDLIAEEAATLWNDKSLATQGILR